MLVAQVDGEGHRLAVMGEDQAGAGRERAETRGGDGRVEAGRGGEEELIVVAGGCGGETAVAGIAPVRGVLADVLGLSHERVAGFEADTPLFGALPELDSMAVAGVLTELEDRLDILIEDDEVDGEMLETFGQLVAFANTKARA